MKKLLHLLLSLVSFSGLFASNSLGQLGSGANALKANAYILSVCTDASGNIYAGGMFIDDSDYAYVAKWNGNTWSELATGSKILKAYGQIGTICSDIAGNIYAAGNFTIGNRGDSTYVAKWDGSNWSVLGQGANLFKGNGVINSICADKNGNIYAAGDFMNSDGKQYVAKWDGNTWGELTGTTPLNANNTIFTICADTLGHVYAAGKFTNSSNYNYVSEWEQGIGWSETGGGYPLNANDWINTICTDLHGNVYAAGNFKDINGNNYVSNFNGGAWTTLGSGANMVDTVALGINALCTDAQGNLFAAAYGHIPPYSAQLFIAKWDGATWTNFGDVDNNGNGDVISSLCTDKNGYIYAGGGFTNASGQQYVATNAVVAGISEIAGPQDNFTVYPNPAADFVTIKTDKSTTGANWQLEDITGKNILTGRLAGETTIVNLQQLATGMYFLRMGGNGQAVKVVKE